MSWMQSDMLFTMQCLRISKEVHMFSELAVDKEDIARLAQEDPVQFALLRRRGFGASDSSIILGVNHWTKLPDLIAQKNSAEVTPE